MPSTFAHHDIGSNIGIHDQGPVNKHLTQVGNAVPLLMAWAIFGAVYAAAYGVDPPLPEFVQQRQIAAGKTPARSEDEYVSMDTITDDIGNFWLHRLCSHRLHITQLLL